MSEDQPIRERSIDTLTFVSEARPRVQAMNAALSEAKAASAERVEITTVDLQLLLTLAGAALEGYAHAAAKSLRVS